MKKVLMALFVGIAMFAVASLAVAEVAPDAAFVTAQKKAIFFSGGKFTQIDLAAESQDDGFPQDIAAQFPGMQFADGVDAAVRIGTNVFFFKGSEYTVWELNNAKVKDGYPKPISDFGGLNADKVDAAFYHEGSKMIFFFMGDSYTIYSLNSETLGEGYPHKFADDYQGLGFDSIDSACLNGTNLLVTSGEKYNVYILDEEMVKRGGPWTLSRAFVGMSF